MPQESAIFNLRNHQTLNEKYWYHCWLFCLSCGTNYIIKCLLKTDNTNNIFVVDRLRPPGNGPALCTAVKTPAYIVITETAVSNESNKIWSDEWLLKLSIDKMYKTLVPSTHHSHHPSPLHSFTPGLKLSFSANPSHHSLPFLLLGWPHGFPGLFTDTSEHIRFFSLLLLFSTVSIPLCRLILLM